MKNERTHYGPMNKSSSKQKRFGSTVARWLNLLKNKHSVIDVYHAVY